MKALASKIRPIKDHVLVRDMNFGEQYTASGIYIPSDDGKSEGIKPRWGKVFAVGPNQTDPDLQPGKWIYIEHGRWTRGIEVEEDDGTKFMIWRVENKSVLLSADQKPNELELGKFSTPEHGSVHSPEDFVRY